MKRSVYHGSPIWTEDHFKKAFTSWLEQGGSYWNLNAIKDLLYSRVPTICPTCHKPVSPLKFSYEDCLRWFFTTSSCWKMEVLMKRPDVASPSAGGAPKCPDAAFAKRCPLLVEYLTTTAWEDGKARERSTISLWVDDDVFKASLNDKELDRSLYRSSKSVLEALEALEKALREGCDADWRAWGNAKKK